MGERSRGWGLHNRTVGRGAGAHSQASWSGLEKSPSRNRFWQQGPFPEPWAGVSQFRGRLCATSLGKSNVWCVRSGVCAKPPAGPLLPTGLGQGLQSQACPPLLQEPLFGGRLEGREHPGEGQHSPWGGGSQFGSVSREALGAPGQSGGLGPWSSTSETEGEEGRGRGKREEDWGEKGGGKKEARRGREQGRGRVGIPRRNLREPQP